MITPDQAKAPNAKELMLMEQWEADIDEKLQSESHWEDGGFLIWTPPFPAIPPRILRLLTARYTAAGWAVEHHASAGKARHDFLKFREAGKAG